MKRDVFVYSCGYCGATYRQAQPMEKCMVCWQPAGEWLRCISHPAGHGQMTEEPKQTPTEERAEERAGERRKQSGWEAA